MNTQKEDMIQSSLRAAKEWDLKGDPNWASRCYSTGLLGILSKVVTSCDNVSDGVAQLKLHGFKECIRDVLRSFQSLRGEIVAGKLPWATLGGNYHLIVFSHLGTLLGEDGAAAGFLSLANESEVERLSPKFWAAYGRALRRFSQKQEIELPQFKLRAGLEQYWLKYILLMRDLVRGIGVSDGIRDVAAAFESRNQDWKIKDDQYEIEGSLVHPVCWDFRKDAILLLAK